ncbi:hypothetical protein DVH24_025872 [Malus domestica]|uniref:cellulase n=1 Tax=Malus domestica TaxID=3750 RepID=A0A498KH70_MALDO|nr:hypothetical protein DVH24_025872 [Malus domestica]
MVGFGQTLPRKIHQRGSVIPSMDKHPQHMQCHEGYFAIVGGPAENDTFQETRYNVPQSEPTIYINAPFVGVLAYFKV